jgi:hypothetical protein
MMENNFSLSRRKALGLAAAGLFAPSRAMAAPIPVLVELFTSQGCSSCPAADALAHELKKQPGVMLLSLNVDYWDYLGWRDTLAKPAFTKRQMNYAHARGDMDVYTPQMIINGAAHVVGSNHNAVQNAINTARQAQTLNFTKSNDEISFAMPSVSGAATLWALSYEPSITVKIERGENSGKTITYQNVVRQVEKLAEWNGTARQISVQSKGLTGTNKIVLLQRGDVGEVLAMAKLA